MNGKKMRGVGPPCAGGAALTLAPMFEAIKSVSSVASMKHTMVADFKSRALGIMRADSFVSGQCRALTE